MSVQIRIDEAISHYNKKNPNDKIPMNRFRLGQVITPEKNYSEIAKNMSLWASGTHEPKITTLMKLAEATGTTTDFLLGRTDKPN